MFIHFGLNTFNETEWSDGTLPVSSYQPTSLNPDQWVSIAKEAGFRHVILVTKHHDGFCLWNSNFTEYDVASSPVKTDVVRAVAEACKKYKIKLGLYYSLWDRHEPTYKEKDPHSYIQYMHNQLGELLTNYGEICELWFDGAWDRKAENWYIPELYQYIKSLQPNCAVTINHTIGRRNNPLAIGKPADFNLGDTIRFYPVDFRTKDPNLVRYDDPKLYSFGGRLHYLPFEHTICLSDRWNWFQKKQIIPARPTDELEQLFYWTTRNDNALLINVPPDQNGLIRENEKQAIFELADRLDIRGGSNSLPAAKNNIVFKSVASASNTADGSDIMFAIDANLESYWMAKERKATLVLDFQRSKRFKKMALLEFADMLRMNDGFSAIRKFRIKKFSIEIFKNHQWLKIFEGDEIGACKQISFEQPYQTDKIKINIMEADAPAGFYHISLTI